MLDPQHSPDITVGGEHLVELHQLWTELSRYPVWDTLAALRHFLVRLCSLMQASDATWMVLRKHPQLPREIASEHYQTIFDKMLGWAPVAAEYLNPDKEFKKVAERWLMHARKEGIDPVTARLLQSAGRFNRCFTRNDVSTDEEWNNHWISKNFLKFYGVGERLISITPQNHECESCIIVDRPQGAPAYTPEERDLLVFVASSIPVLHKRLCLERGLIGASAVLSKRETDTYRLLLTELSESEIAEKLCLSTHTVHDYARQLYKKFNVKGRVGLMAMVLDA